MIRRALLAAATVLLLPQAAGADTRSCTVAVNTLAFGTFSGSEVNNTTQIMLTCNGTGSGNLAVITLSRGSSNNFNDRQMRNGPSTLHYNIYALPGHVIIWGDGSGVSGAVSTAFNFTGPGPVTRTLTAFGQVQAQRTPAAGHYTDQIVVTVTF